MDVRHIFIALAAGAGLYLAYEVSGTLLLVFAGVLLAVVLDAAVAALGRILPTRRAILLAIVSLTAFVALAAGLIGGGYGLVSQAQEMFSSVSEQTERLIDLAADYGIELPVPGEDGSAMDYLPSPELLFGHAQSAFGLTLGAIGNAVVIIFLGLFFAVDPAGYRDGFLRLIAPARRGRVGEVLTEAGHALRWWLVGQLAMMTLVAISVSILLLVAGIPNAVPLGILAGALNFVPYLGPILAAIPVFLAAAPEGATTLLVVATAFIVIQSIEGYLIAPMIQERAVHIPAAWSLAALLVAGALFGGIGIALATPLLAVTRILVLRLYVEDVLEAGGRPISPLVGEMSGRTEGGA